MQEFTIVCTTCQSRIKVRNPNLVGQIVPCPKCAGMVLVENSSKIVVAPNGVPANSQTVTKESLTPPAPTQGAGNPESVEGEAGRRQRFKSDAAAVAKRSVDSPEPTNRAVGPPLVADVKSTNPTGIERTVETTAVNVDWNRGNLAQAEWTTSRARIRRQMLLVFFLSLSGCIIAGVLFTLFVKSLGDNKVKLAAGDAAEVASGGETATTTPPASDPPEIAVLEIAAPEIATQESKATATDSEEKAVEPNETTGEKSSDKTTPTEELEKSSTVEGNALEEPGIDPVSVSPKVDASGNSEKEMNQAADSPKADEKDGAGDSKSEEEGKPVGEQNLSSMMPTVPGGAEQGSSGQQLPDSLLKLAAVFDSSLETRLSETPTSETPAAKPTPDIASLSVITKEKLHPPEEKPLPTAKRLTEELAGIEIVDRPLAEVLEVWSQITGLGLEIAWNEVAAANVLPQQKVSLKNGRIKYGDMLNSILDPIGLEAIASEESLVRIAAKPEAIGKLLPSDWSIADLITEKCDAAALKDMLDRLLPAMKESWKIADAKIEWGADGKNPFQQYLLLELLEHLRVMRGLPLKSGYDSIIFQRSWPSPTTLAGNSKTLQQPIFKQVPVSQVVISAGREVDELVSFDWAGTWQHGLAPTTEDTLLPRGRTLEQLASAVCIKYGLDYAWLSSDHILMTTAARLSRMETTLHFSVEETTGPEVLKKKLALISALSPEGLPSIRFARDPHSGMVLAKIRPLRTSEIPQDRW